MKKNSLNHKFNFDKILIFLLITESVLSIFKILPQEIDKNLLAIIAIISTIPVFVNSFYAIKNKEINVEHLASVALFLSLISGEYLSAIFINLMLTFARIFSDITKDQTHFALQALLKLRPQFAKLKLEKSILKIPVEKVKVSNLLIVELGDRIPVDGVILDGTASIDESSFTGESLPIDKKVGDKVFASTIISSGQITIRAEKVGKETSFEKIVQLIENSQKNKAKIATFGDKFSKIYLISTFALALIIYFYSKDLNLVLGVLLVVCADDIAVAVPLAFMAGIGVAAKKGIIIKGASFLEGISDVKKILFDKTGTLTLGKLKVENFVTLNSYSESEVVKLAGIASFFSNHPISKTISEFIQPKLKTAIDCNLEHSEESGKGTKVNFEDENIFLGKLNFLKENEIEIRSQEEKIIQSYAIKGFNVTCLGFKKKLIAIFILSDSPKENAIKVIQKLKDLGIKDLEILTGDNEKIAENISTKLGLTNFHANLLPEDKINFLKKDLNENYKIAMVGDGVNDAPVLTLADIGIAMGKIGSDIAIESADIVITNDNIENIPELFGISKRVMNAVYLNFGLWIFLNSIGLFLVYAGVLNPAGAAAYNFLTDFIPIANSLRLTS